MFLFGWENSYPQKSASLRARIAGRAAAGWRRSRRHKDGPGAHGAGHGATDASALRRHGDVQRRWRQYLHKLTPEIHGSYVTNNFTQVDAPGGGTTRNESSYITTMLDLPDGTVLYAEFDNQLYVYQPVGAQLAAGKPTILSITPNLDGA